MANSTDYKKIVGNREALCDISRLRFESPNEFRTFLNAIKEYNQYTYLQGVHAVTITENIRQHPEYLDELIRVFNEGNNCQSFSITAALVALNLIAHKFISPDKAQEIFTTLIRHIDNFSYDQDCSSIIHKMAIILPENSQIRHDLYETVRVGAKITPELIRMLSKDFETLNEETKQKITVAILDVLSDELEKLLKPYIDSKFFMDFLYYAVAEIIRRSGIQYIYENKVFQCITLLDRQRQEALFKKIREIPAVKTALMSTVKSRFFGYAAGIFETCQITEPYTLEVLSPIICLLDDSKFKDFCDSCSAFVKSTYSAVFLNNNAVLNDQNGLIKFLKQYLKARSEDIKLKNHLLTLDVAVINALSHQELAILIERSFEVESNILRPIRFQFTREAIDTLKTKATPLMLTGKLSSENLSNFLKAHTKNVYGSDSSI